MTKEEFISKYGGVPVTFARYYKNRFYFKTALLDGKALHVSCRLDYHLEVVAGYEELIRELKPDEGWLYDGTERLEGFEEE